jgi:hypothetical protein
VRSGRKQQIDHLDMLQLEVGYSFCRHCPGAGANSPSFRSSRNSRELLSSSKRRRGMTSDLQKARRKWIQKRSWPLAWRITAD